MDDRLSGAVADLERDVGEPPAFRRPAQPTAVPASAVSVVGQVVLVEEVRGDEIRPGRGCVAVNGDGVVGADVVCARITAETGSDELRQPGAALMADRGRDSEDTVLGVVRRVTIPVLVVKCAGAATSRSLIAARSTSH